MTPEERISELEGRLRMYETNGAAKLFYSLNRKMNELADMLNKQSLTNLDLADAKDKSFERLKIAWSEASNIATAVDTLGKVAGVTGDEALDTIKPVYRKPITPETISNDIGEIAGQKRQ